MARRRAGKALQVGHRRGHRALRGQPTEDGLNFRLIVGAGARAEAGVHRLGQPANQSVRLAAVNVVVADEGPGQRGQLQRKAAVLGQQT